MRDPQAPLPGAPTDPPYSPVSVPGSPGPSPYRTSRWAKLLLTLGVLVVLVPSVAAFVPVPYVVLKPGPISNVLGKSESGKPLITVRGAPTYPTTGRLDFTTVSIEGGPGSPASALDVFLAQFRSSVAVYPQDAFFPKGSTKQQVQDESAAEMTDSQQEAIAVALTGLGRPVTQKVTIAGFPTGSPAEAAGLAKGDRVTGVDGRPTPTSEAVRAAVLAHRPGEPVTVDVLRAGKAVQAKVVTTDQGGRAAIGVYLAIDFVFPFEVDINAGDVGGPSAGLMFSLGIYDLLTPGPLTGGADVAGTGTIDHTGAVGPIGGIRQKLIGARDGGAEWFLAPAGDCNEVVGHVPSGLHVVRVSTFDQALSAVEDIAAKKTSGLPTCTAG